MKKNGCLTLPKSFIKFYIQHKILIQNKFECTTMKLDCMYLCISTGIILINNTAVNKLFIYAKFIYIIKMIHFVRLWEIMD